MRDMVKNKSESAESVCQTNSYETETTFMCKTTQNTMFSQSHAAMILVEKCFLHQKQSQFSFPLLISAFLMLTITKSYAFKACACKRP